MKSTPRPLTSGLSKLAAALLLLGSLAVAPNAADARVGSGFSIGSRGSHTYSMPAPTRTAPYGASPFDRSMTPRAAPYGGSMMAGGMMGRGHPLAAGLLGGFLGAGLAGMLFGHGFFGGGVGLGGLLGMLIQLALIVVAVRWLLRRFAGAPAPSMAGAAPGMGYPQPTARMRSGSNLGANAPPLMITQPDYKQFEQSLRDVQSAWTRADIGSLQRLATPEMVSYFGQQLQDLQRRGLRNAVSNVRLEQGDLSEAWSEPGRDYATLAMRYSMVDVTTDATGRVVDGSANERVSATEFWTFVRANGSNWLLSAIQQAR